MVPIPGAIPVETAVRTCTVELFGTAQLLAKAKMVSLTLPPEATLARVLSSLAETLPMLVGRVIAPEGNRLASGFACNINGLAFVRDPAARIHTETGFSFFRPMREADPCMAFTGGSCISI